MGNFDWGVFWAALAAFGIAHLVTIGLPVNVTLSLRDFQAIVGKLESIECSLQAQEDTSIDEAS